MSIRDKYAFVGVGLTEQGKVPGSSVEQLATEAILRALADSGMRKDEIDGCIFQPGFGGGPVGNAPLWAAGIPSRFCWELQTGGATGISTVAAAIGAMEAGLCRASVAPCTPPAPRAWVLAWVRAAMRGALLGPMGITRPWHRQLLLPGDGCIFTD